jgi:serine/threonine-protein kinase
VVALAFDSLDACPQCGAVHPPSQLRCPKTDVMLPLRGRVLDGRFRFVEVIGRGGMASVWLAVNERVDRRVAIKLIRPEVARDEDMVARFRSEARAAGRIGHPNICDILDSGVSPIGPYIVMELLEGSSLGERLAGGRRLAVAEAVMVVREALRGLQAAHRAGIVHRDLKPENVFVHRPPGGATIVKLMDFGVAKFTDGSGEAQTAHGALLGTPEYMAPEQFRGAAFAEPRTDLWATGAILYRALTGSNAFGGATVAATLLAVTTDDPPRVDAVVASVPRGLADVVARCLAKAPDNRFDDAAALDEALAPFDVATRDEATWTTMLRPADDAEDAAPGADEASARSRPASEHIDEPSHRTRVWNSPDAAPGAGPRRGTTRTLVATGVLAVIVGWAWAGRGDDAARATAGDATDDGRIATGETRGISGDAVDDASRDGATAPTHDAAASTAPSAMASATAPTAPSTAGVGPEAPGDAALELERPRVPPAPALDAAPDAAPPEDVVVVTDDDASAPRKPSGGSKPADAPPVDPPGVVRDGKYVALVSPGPLGTLRKAADYCEGLAAAGHLGIRRWELPNPVIAPKFAGSKGFRKGRYWTTALWRGKAITVTFPAGTKQSTPADDNKTRVFCIARWP